jgi:hypothetical protein
VASDDSSDVDIYLEELEEMVDIPPTLTADYFAIDAQ